MKTLPPDTGLVGLVAQRATRKVERRGQVEVWA